jgi:hypothetical protein
MSKQKKRRDGALGRLLVRLGLAPRHKRIPVFGIQGVGKSYFILSVAYFISKRSLGKVIGASADYVTNLLPVMMLGERLDATPGYRDIDLEVNHIYRANYEQLDGAASGDAEWRPSKSFLDDASESGQTQEQYGEQGQDSELIPCEFMISTNDLSGTQFKDAVGRLAEPTARLGGDPQTQRFLQVLEAGEGAIIVVDVVRQEMTTDEFTQEARRHIRRALAEQVVPLARGIQLSIMKGSKRNKVFPLFLVFTKRDIHQLSRAELEKIVKEVFAILLANLEAHVKVRVHSVQNIGFGVDPESVLEMEGQTEGIGFFLADLYFWINQM